MYLHSLLRVLILTGYSYNEYFIFVNEWFSGLRKCSDSITPVTLPITVHEGSVRLEWKINNSETSALTE